MRAGHVHGPLATNLPPISGTRTASALALVKSETFVLGQTSSGNQSISSMNLDNISRPLDSSWPQGHDNKATRLESMNEDDPLPQIQESNLMKIKTYDKLKEPICQKSYQTTRKLLEKL